MANRVRQISFSGRGRVAPRKTEWFPSADTAALTVLLAANAIFDQSLIATELALRPFTVVRVRGSVYISSDQSGAVERQLGAIGFAVVSEEAIAVGGTALPIPISNEGSGLWFVHRIFANAMRTTTDSHLEEFPFDSKAMRKVEQGQNIAVMIENADSTFGLQYWLKFRLLVKLH